MSLEKSFLKMTEMTLNYLKPSDKMPSYRTQGYVHLHPESSTKEALKYKLMLRKS